ncbi:MAG: hypothetical protein Q4C96_01395 [Planctomycetia bacterium]|nr:hypothetical protein [Planctomycetia bacterium]
MMRKMWTLFSVCVVMAAVSVYGGETKSLLVGVPADSSAEAIIESDETEAKEIVTGDAEAYTAESAGEEVIGEPVPLNGGSVLNGTMMDGCVPEVNCGVSNYQPGNIIPVGRRHCRRARCWGYGYNNCYGHYNNSYYGNACTVPACEPACARPACEPACAAPAIHCEPQFREVTCRVKKPVWREVQKEVTYCVRIPYQEVKTRTYTVNVPRWQTREEQVCVRVCVPVQEQVMRTVCRPCYRTVCVPGHCGRMRVCRVMEMVPTQECCMVTRMVPQMQMRTVQKRFCTMEPQQRTQQYTVCKWRTEQRTKTVTQKVCDWVEETVVKKVPCVAPQPACQQPCDTPCVQTGKVGHFHRVCGWRRACRRACCYGYGYGYSNNYCCDGNLNYNNGYTTAYPYNGYSRYNYPGTGYYNSGYTTSTYGGYTTSAAGCGCK